MRRGWWWLLFVVAVLAGLFFLLTMIIGVTEAFSGHEAVGSGIAAAVILGLITLGLVWLAWVAEHRARGRVLHHHPADAVAAPWSGPAPARPRPRPARSRRSRRDTPASLLTTTVFFTVATACWVTGAVVLCRDWRQSVATQDHGVAFQAQVTDAVDVAHSSRSGTYHTTHLTVSYPYAVGSRTSGVIRAPHREEQDTIGSTVAVRVDRSDPGHVELAGVADTGPAGFIILTILAALFAVMTAAFAVAWVKLRRLRRRRAAPPD